MLISRVADHCFWFGRYLERAHVTARTMAVTRELALGADLEDNQSWKPAVIVAGEEERFNELEGADKAEDAEVVQNYMVWREENPSSLRNSVRAVRANGRSIRDRLSTEAWETVNELHLWMKSDKSRRLYEKDRHQFFEKVSRSMVLATGQLRSTMMTSEPLDFIRLGSMLERAGQTARTVDVHHHAIGLAQAHVVVDTALWLGLLRACGGFHPFMGHNRGRVSGRAVANFLVLEPRFPRSVAYAVQSALKRLNSIRPAGVEDYPGTATHRRLSALSRWGESRFEHGIPEGELHEALTHVVDEVHAICNLVGVEFLGYETAAE